ncbi:hypothetical protein LTR95_005287 [Oleoguttula sp. CCFEE 5521]
MIKHVGEYEPCEQPFSTFIDVAYIFMVLLLKMSARREGFTFKPALRDPDLEFVIGEADGRGIRDDTFRTSEYIRVVNVMVEEHAATIRLQPRMRSYIRWLTMDVTYMGVVMGRLRAAQGAMQPRIRRAFIHTVAEILMLGGIMRSSKLTFLGPLLNVVDVYVE